MSDYSHISEIILRKLNGSSTAEEEELLAQWKNENLENAQEFELTKQLWNDSAEALNKPFNTEKAWQKVAAQTTAKPAKVRTLFPFKKVIPIAATLIIIMGIFYMIYQPKETEWNIMVAENQHKKIKLPDSSIISLRQGSKIYIPKNYGSKNRLVKLEGEAYFEVTHNQQSPFTLSTSKSIIKDIGTAFLVKTNHTTEQVTVLEGVVSFAHRQTKETAIVLKAGESGSIKNEKISRIKLNTGNLLSWRSKILIFRNTPLAQVAADLKDYYQIEVELPPALASMPITAEFKNEPLQQVIQELTLFTGLQLQIKNNRLNISK